MVMSPQLHAALVQIFRDQGPKRPNFRKAALATGANVRTIARWWRFPSGHGPTAMPPISASFEDPAPAPTAMPPAQPTLDDELEAGRAAISSLMTTAGVYLAALGAPGIKERIASLVHEDAEGAADAFEKITLSIERTVDSAERLFCLQQNIEAARERATPEGRAAYASRQAAAAAEDAARARARAAEDARIASLSDDHPDAWMKPMPWEG